MILKLKHGAGWHYLDGVERLNTHGSLRDDGGGLAAFSTLNELADAIDRTWGNGAQRQFDRELWPDFDSDLTPNSARRPPCYVDVAVAVTRDGRNYLVMWNDEAFLLSDEGHTVDRLR